VLGWKRASPSRASSASADKELASFAAGARALLRELTRQQSLVRVTQRHLGLAPPAPPAKSAPGKKKRRRAVVRALTAAKAIANSVPPARVARAEWRVASRRQQLVAEPSGD